MPSSEVHAHEFSYGFASLCLSYLNRYPSPLSPHIISSDYLSVHVDESGCLHASKLVLKRGKLPRWAPSNLISKAETYVLETCTVDPVAARLSSVTRNLDHRTVLDVTEHYSLRPLAADRTLNEVQGDIKSSVGMGSTFGSLLRGRIAYFGLSSFNRNVVRSRDSLLLIHSLLHHPDSPYRRNILFRDVNGPLPEDLLEPKWAGVLKQWQEIGAGFVGHGFKEPEEATAEPDRMEIRRNRPDYLELGNWAWWQSRWRPHLPLVFYLPARLIRQPEDETRWQRFRRKGREFWAETVAGMLPGSTVVKNKNEGGEKRQGEGDDA